ncbi:putative glucosyl glucuronosyl [Diplodia seriata]|uniref:Putative glucosyl glucuronosyl n=1 Tax=Diplodia seriata TaxID=420778 RepID=A0A0G2H7E9_9PEZI|nr:putative glucosyl glucuronosyl [Diplodia seriata]
MRSPSLRSRSGSSIPAAEPLQPADPPPDAVSAAPPPTSTPAADHKQAETHDNADSISHASSEPPLWPPPPYDGPAAAPHGRCAILPAHEARWRTKGKDADSTPLSTLAATVLVSEGQLEGGDVQLLLPPESTPTDPLSAIALSTYATIHDIVLGAAEGPREAYRQLRRAREEAAAKEAQAYDYRSLSLLGSAGYDDDAVGEEDGERFGDYRPTAPPSVASASSVADDGRGLGYGLFDGITGLFVQPVKGAQKEGPVGFLKGFGKGLGGIVCKPAAGALGVPGYAFTGIQRSIEKELSRKASPEECLAAAEVLQGEDEMRRLSDKERMDIVAAWLAR